MTHYEKINWMALWCTRHGVALQLVGECGFGRECVGITTQGSFPDYEWYDEAPGGNFERIDENGEVWTPEDAYHKSPCVAVLGRGEGAEGQLYDWLVWFDKNGFVVETVMRPVKHMVQALLGQHLHSRMVRKPVAGQP